MKKTIRINKLASPLNDVNDPWQVTEANTENTLSKLKGISKFKGRCGVSIDPYGVFLCKILSIERNGDVIITNDPSLGKTELPQMPPTRVEQSALFPIIRGRDIKKWKATPVYTGIILNSSTRKIDMPSESDIKRFLPKTYAYLYQMKRQATEREKFWHFFSKPYYSEQPLSEKQMESLGRYVRRAGRTEDGRYIYEVADGSFFALFNVGSYTFLPFKVSWPMGTNAMRAAVISSFSFEVGGRKTEPKSIIPATGTTSYVLYCTLE